MVAKILISPNLEPRKEEIDKILLHLGGVTRNHPDLLYIIDGEKLGIEQARKIKDHFVYKPNKAKGKAVVLENADNITTEAQNALLKTIEELPEHALFIIGASSENNFLPTILSRCEIITLQPGRLQAKDNQNLIKYEDDSFKNIERLLGSDIQTRFGYIESLKDKEEFLKNLILFFQQKLYEKPDTKTAYLVKEILQAERWASQNVNIRGILEYLMLVI